MKLKHLQYLVAAGALLVANESFAAGTLASTAINNTATVNYQIGGVNQAAIGSSPTGNTTGAGTPTVFLVDRQLDVLVTANDTGQTVQVSPGQNATVLSYTVTNEGNDTQDFLLAALQRLTGVTGDGNGNDNFNSTAAQAFVESGATPGYQPGQDTAVFIDQLAPDTSRIVYIVSNIPLGQVNNDIAKITLVAQVADGTAATTQGAAITNDTNGHISPAGTYSNGATAVAAGVAATTADVAAAVQNVFRDDTPTNTEDVNSAGLAGQALNGQNSETETLQVSSATLTVKKTSVVISDPVNGVSANAKAIPGAVIEYCVIVANASTTAAATTLAITDAVPANTVYLPGTLLNAVTVTGGTAGTVTGACNSATGTAQTDAADGDNGSAVGTGAPGTGTITLNYATVPVTSTVASKFRVTLQ